jgi:hypothetical protein
MCVTKKFYVCNQIDHVPLEWGDELCWITKHTKGKGWRAKLLKSAAAEAVYTLWNYRNDISAIEYIIQT